MNRRKNRITNIEKRIFLNIILIFILIFGYINTNIKYGRTSENTMENITQNSNVLIDLSSIPEYSSSPYVEINNNKPYFQEEDYTTEIFEKYSHWDEKGRSQVAFANVCKEIMPTEGEEREAIGNINKLSGWVQKRYDTLIKDKYLYNRCHLIAWQLAGENANKENLITGTRYLNTEGMLPFENKVAEYMRNNKNNHVLYRVTPIFEGDNKLASGVEIEAYSVEDNGSGICFNVYCYNAQPGIEIDYSTGESHEK